MAATPNLTGKALIVHKNHRAGSGECEIHASTERALVLRKAAGELVVSRKISGPEKLVLLAEELMATALHPRLDLEELLRIADSQLWLHLSEISNLKDPLFFYDDIATAIESHIESAQDKDGRRPLLISDPPWIASVIGSRIHNLYLLSAGWRIVKTVIKELNAMHLDASEAREHLARNTKLREKYLSLYDMVMTLARLGQQRVANIAATTPHYAKFFHVRTVTSGRGDSELQLEFDCHNPDLRQLRQAHRSFIDSIVLELVLPNSPYPPYILMTLLRNAIDECRKEESRFSQALWDAIGDFSMTIQALDLIEGPLLGEERDAWLRNSAISKEYVEFLKMQDLSLQVIQESSSWGTCFNRLIDTKDKACLNLLWQSINESCRRVTGGKTMEALWSLQSEMQRSAQWSSTFNADIESGDSDDDSRALILHPITINKAKRGIDRLRITSGPKVDDEDDIPELRSSSDSSEEAESTSESSHEDNGDYESDFDETEDEMYQEDLRDAMSQIIDMFLDTKVDISELQKTGSNPFVKMFANLRDRLFTANSTLRPDGQSRRPYKQYGTASSSVPAVAAQPKKIDSSQTETRGVTIENAEDDDDHPSKKKRKKRKAKKPQGQHSGQRVSEQDGNQGLGSESPVVPVSFQNITPTQSPFSVKSLPSTQSPTSSPGRSAQSLSPKSIPTKQPENNYSRFTLPASKTAQSARSYLQAESLTGEKSKTKSRPAFPGKNLSNFGGDENSKHGGRVDAPRKDNILQRIKKINLPKKAGELMQRLIGNTDGKTHAKKPMKWDDFVKVMRVMGFTYVPGTAGSSVRFDPPHPKDPSITFHKPHPDTTLQRHHLREFGKKLTKIYGWRKEMFSTFGVEEKETD